MKEQPQDDVFAGHGGGELGRCMLRDVPRLRSLANRIRTCRAAGKPVRRDQDRYETLTSAGPSWSRAYPFRPLFPSPNIAPRY